jgi:hypothetical protein
MLKLLHQLHLTIDVFASSRVLKLDLIVSLDSHFGIRRLMEPKSNNGICTLSYLSAHRVVFQVPSKEHFAKVQHWVTFGRREGRLLG